MASPQLDNGFTPIANEIVEALMRINLSAYESRVLWFIFRKTYGWQKKTDRIPLSQFSKAIGIDRRLVHRALQKLADKRIIVIYRDDKNKVSYGFQKNYEKWKVSSKKMTVISTDDNVSSPQMTKVSSIEIPSKEKKKTKQKKGGNGVPQCPHQEIVELYHKILPELPAVKDWHETRQKKLRARWREKMERQNLGWWKKYFRYVKETDFLLGENGRNWQPDLECLVEKEKLTRVIEGKYENGRMQPAGSA